MKYKGYTGVVEFDEESSTLFGHVIGLRDGITFQGDSVSEVIQAFHDSVDDYLEFCAERGESPEKPYSGQFVLRIDPQLHRVMSHAAEERGASLNSLIEDRLKESFGLAGSSGIALERAPQETMAAKRSPRPATPGSETGVILRPRMAGQQHAQKGLSPGKSRAPKSSTGSAPGKGRKS
jgi:predicted HicB family RNase H-like nuclease